MKSDLIAIKNFNGFVFEIIIYILWGLQTRNNCKVMTLYYFQCHFFDVFFTLYRCIEVIILYYSVIYATKPVYYTGTHTFVSH